MMKLLARRENGMVISKGRLKKRFGICEHEACLQILKECFIKCGYAYCGLRCERRAQTRTRRILPLFIRFPELYDTDSSFNSTCSVNEE